MPGRCGFELDVHRVRERCANWLATEYDYIHDHPPVDDIEAFADLPRGDDGCWQCPRRATQGERCVLHSESSTDTEICEAVEATLRGDFAADEFAVDVPDGEYLSLAARFIGIEVNELDLRGRQQSTTTAAVLDFRHADIGTLSVRDVSLDDSIRLEAATLGEIEATDAELGGSIRARFATVERGVAVDRATVEGRIDCRFTELGRASLSHASAGSRFDFGFAHVDGAVDAFGGVCGGRFTLKEAVVGELTAGDIAVSGPDPESDIPGLQFRGLTTRGSVSIEGADCEGQLLGYRMDIGGDFDAAAALITQGVSLGTRSGTRLGEAAIAGSLSFSDAHVDGECEILGRDDPDLTLTVGGEVDLSGATFEHLAVAPELTHDRLTVVDCREATIRAGVLSQPAGADSVIYDLERAELGAVRIEPGDSTAPDCLWLNRTTFAGFTFVDAARRDFQRANWELIDEDAERRDAVAFARVFGDATEYARDFAAICAAQPRTREWLRESDPPSDPDALAERVFAGVDENTVERVARNGPENREQLGPELFARERYRVGVVTLLARCLHPLDEGKPLAATLVDGAGEHLQPVAERVDGKGDADDAVSALRDGVADALTETIDVSRTLEAQELTYINARKGADDVGDSSTAGNLFVNELRVRRRIHAREGNYGNYGANLVFDAVAGYGERPGQAFIASICIIGAFTGIYMLLWEFYPPFSTPVYEGLGGGMLLSSASFTAFVLGGASVEPRLVRFLANFEALLGAFMIALFVFTLTRSLHR